MELSWSLNRSLPWRAGAKCPSWFDLRKCDTAIVVRLTLKCNAAPDMLVFPIVTLLYFVSTSSRLSLWPHKEKVGFRWDWRRGDEWEYFLLWESGEGSLAWERGGIFWVSDLQALFLRLGANETCSLRTESGLACPLSTCLVVSRCLAVLYWYDVESRLWVSARRSDRMFPGLSAHKE